MDALLILAALVLLALAAPRYGVDSRERYRSEEERLASLWGA